MYSYNLAGKRVLIAGYKGMVGAGLCRRLETENCEIIKVGRAQADLTNQSAVEQLIASEKPDVVIIAAAKVGGILANSTYPAEFLYDNLVIASNLIHASHLADVNRLLFLGSSCIYPKMAPQPIQEEALLTGPLEATNEAYAIAKIAGIKLASSYRKQYGRSYISGMPTNLYGPEDNFDLASSHVLPALIRKAHEAKLADDSAIEIWGTGTPMREFLHVDDCADALVHTLKHYDNDQHINIGSGSDISILELTKLICSIVGFNGEIIKDSSKPDGTLRKLMAADKLKALGWTPKISLEDGISSTYKWYLDNTQA